jgi:pimeloyl-ACP methyl ester carboxylesterase
MALLFVPLVSRSVLRPVADSQVPRWEPVGREAFPIRLPDKARIDTGFLVVLEDRSKPKGRTIRLPVAIVRSSSPSPAPDPVVYTTGGPGGSSLNAAAYGGAYRFTDTRDLIVFEQRGTAHAQPPLECPEVNAARLNGSIDPTPGRRREVAAAKACRERLVQSGINPAAYTTAASAADLEDLRRVLGIRQWNLYGESYSTRLMLTVVRDYPDGVRSAVLDSALPPDEPYEAGVAAGYTQSIEAVFKACEAQAACRAAYPNLRDRFTNALEAAERNPLRVKVRPPTDNGERGPEVEIRLRPHDLVNLLSMANSWNLPNIPQRMDLVARRDAESLGPIAEGSLERSGFSWGMRYSVWCGEESNGARHQSREKGLFSVLHRSLPLVVEPQVCAAWSVPTVRRRAVQSRIPVLFINGEYDPYTPSTWAKRAAKTLPNSRAVTIRGASHVPTQFWDQPCAMIAAADFVKEPTEPLSTPCLMTQSPPMFKVPR